MPLLTASRRPDSVGVLSMSASNTSASPVLTYKRTNGKQEKKKKGLAGQTKRAD